MKKKISVICALMLVTSLLCVTVFAANPNYGESKEYLQIYYKGYVQCQPCYNDDGYHAARAYLRYQNGADGDTGRLYTGFGRGPTDGRIYSKSHTYRDTLDPNAPKVRFNYGFDYVPHGSSDWPI